MYDCRLFRWSALRCALCFLLVVGIVTAREAAEQIELFRDQWGIPHIFAASDDVAMYGLGYATAEDRSFQMYHNLRIIQGRLAELIGDVKKTRRNETAVQSDRKMRTFGFYRAAKRVAARLDDESRRLLDAYCDGVNDWMARQRSERHYLFDKLGLQPEHRTPADCIASWWHLAQFFGPDGTRDLVAWRGARAGGRNGRRAGFGPGEPAAAIVRREDVSDRWIAEMNRFLAQHGIGGGVSTRLVYANNDMRNWYGGFFLHDGYIYGCSKEILVCMNFLTGKIAWKNRSVGMGSVVYADGHFVMRGDKGTVALVEATPEEYREKGRFDQPDRSDRPARSYPVVIGGRLYLRDEDVLLCYHVQEPPR